MNKLSFVTILLIVGLFLACEHKSGILREGETNLEKPDQVLDIEKDESFLVDFPEVLHAHNVQIVYDSVLIIQDHQYEDATLFKAYSIDNFHYLGSFVKQGRGPGEIIAPIAVCSDVRQSNLYVRDNATGIAYRVDVEKGLGAENVEFLHKVPLQENVIDWAPLDSTFNLFLIREHNELIIQLSGPQCHTFHPYKGIDANRFIAKLSSIIIGNKINGKFVCALLCFPQIIIIDAINQEIYSSAVDPSYHKWESILNAPFGPESIQYYRNITASDKYILALYDGCPLSDLKKPGHMPSIHIFDWNGKFLYSLKIKESIGSIAYDARSSCLYCTDNSSGQIIRYDLSKVFGE